MSLLSDYNRIFDARRIAKLDRGINDLSIKRKALIKKGLELTNRREKLLGQVPSK